MSGKLFNPGEVTAANELGGVLAKLFPGGISEGHLEAFVAHAQRHAQYVRSDIRGGDYAKLFDQQLEHLGSNGRDFSLLKREVIGVATQVCPAEDVAVVPFVPVIPVAYLSLYSAAGLMKQVPEVFLDPVDLHHGLEVPQKRYYAIGVMSDGRDAHWKRMYEAETGKAPSPLTIQELVALCIQVPGLVRGGCKLAAPATQGHDGVAGISFEYEKPRLMTFRADERYRSFYCLERLSLE